MLVMLYYNTYGQQDFDGKTLAGYEAGSDWDAETKKPHRMDGAFVISKG